MRTHVRAKLINQVIAFTTKLLFDLTHVARNLAEQINHVHQTRLYFFGGKVKCATAFIKSIKRRLCSLKIGLELCTALHRIPTHQ